MNNNQFRRLVLDTPSHPSAQKKSPTDDSSSARGAAPGAGGAGGALGSRMRSSIPMTPRTVTSRSGGPDFARQLAESRRERDPQAKRFKSSSAPKGTRLPSGYQDRAAARLRQEGDDDENNDNDNDNDGNKNKDDIGKRIRALEEMVKLGQMEQATFEKLRGELGVGGDLKSTHLVKGLDWDLLRRVRAGEDVDSKKEDKEKGTEEEEEIVPDVDEEFEKLESMAAAPREKEVKQKEKAQPAKAKSRNEILKELKASREAAAAAAQPALGNKFKRVGESKVEKKRFVEQDENGRRREVLVITDAEGKTKRKTRWLDKPGESNGVPVGLLVPDQKAAPLGMEVPAEIAAKTAPPKEEEDDDDIFAGVGADYNPLGDMPSSSEEDEDEEKEDREDHAPVNTTLETSTATGPSSVPAVEGSSTKPRNYFSTTSEEPAAAPDRSNPLLKDPTLMAALKRAASLRQAEQASGEGQGGDSEARQRKFLEEARRREAMDAADLDMGFGGSRMEDDEEEEDVVLEGEGERGGGKKRKRGPKKKKGDKDSVADVMGVMERRKK